MIINIVLILIGVYLLVGTLFVLVLSWSGMGKKPTVLEMVKFALIWPRYFSDRIF